MPVVKGYVKYIKPRSKRALKMPGGRFSKKAVFVHKHFRRK